MQQATADSPHPSPGAEGAGRLPDNLLRKSRRQFAMMFDNSRIERRFQSAGFNTIVILGLVPRISVG